MDDPSSNRFRRIRVALGVGLLLAIMAGELALSARRQSQTSDEACHIFAGYRYWKNFDYGINPEHPPLVKLVAALPLLRMRLQAPAFSNDYFKVMEYDAGRDFLYANDARSVLWRARMAAALFTLALALAIFALAREMKNDGAAFLALALFVFEPNFLAHGALVTTDVGATLGFFLGVGMFYFYVKQPSASRLAGSGLAAGICLGAKHSGILLFPMLLVLAFIEMFPLWDPVAKRFTRGLAKQGFRLAASLAGIALIAWITLWALYGFRYAARPSSLSVDPPLMDFSRQMALTHPGLFFTLAHWHLLPESYLYGVANIYAPGAIPTVLFGKYYPESQWFYFPSVFVIKSTLAFLILCCLVPLCASLWGKPIRREVLFLIVPAAIYLAAAMTSDFNYGVRHLLPMYPYLIVLAAMCAWEMSRKSRAIGAVVVALILFHAASSIRAYPNYIPYSNELWGGPQSTFRILADSNVDWGQGLQSMKEYLDRRNIQDCWFAYFPKVAVDVSYYGIPCRALPTSYTELKGLSAPIVPPRVDAPVFISSTEIAGAYWRADWANPYLPFRRVTPSAVIAGSILVFDGNVDLSQVSALTHEKAAMKFYADRQYDSALVEAETAVDIAPGRPIAHATRSMILSAMGKRADAAQELTKARAMASAILAGPRAGRINLTLSGFRWQSQ